jgi:hypothetical protein
VRPRRINHVIQAVEEGYRGPRASDGSVVPARLSKNELADRIQALCVLVVDDNQ